ncbi:MAG: ATP-binding protein [Candidatus Omnitrophica bacterium]|nr:ATP-binding protein [Candidatus Omnitrophota bacterium]
MNIKENYKNPFKPGAGHSPPYLAGRSKETEEFLKLLQQETILGNVILTGLRGVGKTVLLEKFKNLAIENKWLWTGTDLSESASISEETMALRLMTDLSIVTSDFVIGHQILDKIGFNSNQELIEEKLSYQKLLEIYNSIPGLVADKLKMILEIVWTVTKDYGKGIIFAYDEAQTISDQAEKGQYPVALLLDVFQSIQKKGLFIMLVLTGLPTLFPKLVDSRTFAERMFRVIFLKKLDPKESRDAIIKPIESAKCPVKFTEESVGLIVKESNGYPYFIQFMCKETYDIFIQQNARGEQGNVPMAAIIAKLDMDFFAGRWARATDRQRELLAVIAKLPNSQDEFTVAEVASESKQYEIDSFSNSHVNQMLSSLANAGLVYKNRYGKYSFAVPLLDQYINRQNIIRKKSGNE